MRILHATDLHFHAPYFEWLRAAAPEFDACCLTGDFLDLLEDWHTGPARQIRGVQSLLRSLTGRVYLCSGNHDWIESGATLEANAAWLLELREPGRVFADGDMDLFSDYRFVCKPWLGALRVPPGAPAVLLAHAPPQGAPVAWQGDEDDGDFELELVASEMPRGSLILSGHVHKARHWHCVIAGGIHCFNPGARKPVKSDAAAGIRGSVPPHVVIDTDRRLAVYRDGGGEIDRVSLRDGTAD